MELLSSLLFGLETVFTPANLAYCFIGALLGTLVGVLPGVGPTATIAILLPLSFSFGPLPAIIMLAGIYYGAQYGGSTTAILVNLPGEASSVVTCLDGYQMARQGRAGPALAISAIGSFVAGCIATVLIAAAAPPMAEFALRFGAPEYFSLMVLGLVAAVVLARGSLLKAVAMVILGISLGLVGTDVNWGVTRYDFGITELTEGLSFVAVAMGMFGFGEIVSNLETEQKRKVFISSIGRVLLTRHDIKSSWKPILRGSLLGSVLGVLPGGGSMLGSFSSYALEKKLARDPSRFGRGAIEGVAGPEAANNAGAQTSFIPLLTLGIPSNAVMALMLGAMMIQGVTPGPQVITQRPDMFWGVIASMLVGNLMLVVLNLPLIGIWIRLLTVPYRLLYPAILIFCCIGIYSLNNSAFDIYVAIGFGLLGYIFTKLDCEPAPLLLGFILGPMMEENLRRALLVNRGDPSIFVERPISLVMLVAAVILLVLVIAPAVRRKREEAFIE
jgi:TctA family transporter